MRIINLDIDEDDDMTLIAVLERYQEDEPCWVCYGKKVVSLRYEGKRMDLTCPACDNHNSRGRTRIDVDPKNGKHQLSIWRPRDPESPGCYFTVDLFYWEKA